MNTTLSNARLDWRYFWLACALLTVVLVAPLVGYEYPGMPDYLNHLARVQLIIDAELYGKSNRYYEVRHVLVSNMGLDGVVPALVWLGLETNTALRVFAGIALLLPVAGVIAVGAVVQRRAPWIALFAFALGYTRYYVFGFLNYFFGVGLALLGYALYLHFHRQRPTVADWRLGAVVVVVGAVTLLTHLMGFGIFGLLVASVELSALITVARAEGVAKAVGQRAVALIPTIAGFVICIAFYALFFEHGLSSASLWHDSLMTKARGVVSPFMGYAPALGMLVAAVLVVASVILAIRRQAALSAGWLPPIAFMVLGFLLLPSDTMGSFYLAARLAVAAWLLLFAFLAISARASVPVKAAIVAIALVTTTAKSVEVSLKWRRSSDNVATMREAIDKTIPHGSLVATVVYTEDPAGKTLLVPEHHVAAFAVIDRGGYMPNLFAFPLNGEAVAFRPEMIGLTMVEKPVQLYAPSLAVPWTRLCHNFDAAVVIDQRRVAPPAPLCGTRAFEGNGFAIYRFNELDPDRQTRSAAGEAHPGK